MVLTFHFAFFFIKFSPIPKNIRKIKKMWCALHEVQIIKFIALFC